MNLKKLFYTFDWRLELHYVKLHWVSLGNITVTPDTFMKMGPDDYNTAMLCANT